MDKNTSNQGSFDVIKLIGKANTDTKTLKVEDNKHRKPIDNSEAGRLAELQRQWLWENSFTQIG